MKHLALIAVLALGACSLTPAERVAVGDGLRAVAVKAVERLNAMDPGKIEIDPDTKDAILFGCAIALEDGNELFIAVTDILAAKFNVDPEVENPVTGAEISAHVETVCLAIESLPEQVEDV